MRYNPAIIEHETSDLIGATIIRTCVTRITIMIHGRVLLKGFWIPVNAFTISHARCMGIKNTARSMYHESFDNVEYAGMCHWIRPLSTDDAVDDIGRKEY